MVCCASRLGEAHRHRPPPWRRAKSRTAGRRCYPARAAVYEPHQPDELGRRDGHRAGVALRRAQIVQSGGLYGRYLASGHVLYLHDAKIFAVPFDLDGLEVTGPPFLALEGVGSNPNGGSAQFAASETGTLVFLSGPIGSAPWARPDLVDGSHGPQDPASLDADELGQPSVLAGRHSPRRRDQRWEALAVWVYEWEHDRASQLTLSPAQNQKPIWTPDGRHIVFWSNRDVQQNLYWQRADGTGDAQRLTNSEYPQSAASWHPGGGFSRFRKRDPKLALT